MKRNNSTGLIIVATALVLCVVVALAIFVIGKPGSGGVAQGGITPTLAQNTPGANAGKPQPIDDYFQGCPPSGDGGDSVLNMLKNRIDESSWQATTVADLLALTWPSGIEQQPHSKWSGPDSQVIAQHEGIPVQAEGYLINVQKQGPETCNCHSVDQVDLHAWLADDPGNDRTQAVVAEVSPRVKSYHLGWTLTNIRNLVKNKQKVRISGWLMIDPEHPDQVGKTRGTIWEIHPIMQIETQQNGRWVPLDSGTTGMHSGRAASQTVAAMVPASTTAAGVCAILPSTNIFDSIHQQ
jgi:hypothetical protein